MLSSKSQLKTMQRMRDVLDCMGLIDKGVVALLGAHAMGP
jgi:hypothetical protein